MRKEYSKEVKSEFEAQLWGAYPQFRNEKWQPSMARNSSLYRFEVNEHLNFFIKLIPHRTFHDFTVEVGWSENEIVPPGRALAKPYEPQDINGAVVRLCIFYLPNSDPWWEVEPKPSTKQILRQWKERDLAESDPNDYLPRVPAVIADAVAKIKMYAIPYFIRIATERGVGVVFDVSNSKS